MLTLPAIFSFAPSANAAVTVETYCFVYAVPDPVGVDQLLLVTYRVDKLSPTAQGTSGGDHFGGFTVTITDPEGTVSTETDLTTDSTSTGWFAYYPTKVGTYTFQAHFPQTTIDNRGVEYVFLASDSAVTEITVQSDPIPTIEDNPLPTSYWTRPIYAENKGWYKISGDWLMQGFDYMSRAFGSASSSYSPYTTAPDTAHILWTKEIIPGGIVGGHFEDQIYYQGLSYEQHYNPLIWNGRIIFTEHDLATTTVYQTRCLDLYTGEEIWILDGVSITCAQVLMTSNPNEHGGVPYLISSSGFGTTNSTLNFYDAWTGRKVFEVFNFTWGGTGMYNVPTRPGPNGEILSFYFDFEAKTLNMWNSTKAIWRPGFIDTWGPTYGSKIDGSVGVEWSAYIPDLVPGMTIWDVTIDEGYLLAYTTDNSVTPYIYTNQAWDISQMKKDANGNYPTTLNTLFTANRTDIWESYFLMTNIGSGVYGMYDQSLCQYHVFSITTGEELWVSDPDTDAWASFNWAWYIAEGKLFTGGYDGYVTTYNAVTGELLWEYFLGSAGYENAYGTFPIYSGFNIADGKLYITNDEHSPDATPWRGGKLWCFDINSGDLLWSISGKLRNGAISCGYFTTLNSLDGQVYTFGKGPSQTTVSAPQAGVSAGSPIAITGTITDQSPGAPNTPCISDQDMSAWMEYLYEQKQMPTDATGVPVVLTAVRSDGTEYNIGTAVSDIGGSYGISWTPPEQGTYQIKATFQGSDSYGSSYATTYLVVGSASASVPTQTPTTGTTPGTDASTETLLIAGVAAVIIIAVIAAALVLRKRK